MFSPTSADVVLNPHSSLSFTSHVYPAIRKTCLLCLKHIPNATTPHHFWCEPVTSSLHYYNGLLTYVSVPFLDIFPLLFILNSASRVILLSSAQNLLVCINGTFLQKSTRPHTVLSSTFPEAVVSLRPHDVISNSYPYFHSPTSLRAAFLFLKHTSHVPSRRSLPLLFPGWKALPLDIYVLILSSPSSRSLGIAPLVRSSLTNLCKIVVPHSYTLFFILDLFFSKTFTDF